VGADDEAGWAKAAGGDEAGWAKAAGGDEAGWAKAAGGDVWADGAGGWAKAAGAAVIGCVGGSIVTRYCTNAVADTTRASGRIAIHGTAPCAS
jgi:hypothetical protein